MSPFEIRRITDIEPLEVEPLVLDSEAEGYRYVRYLVDSWVSGEQRFERPGEVLFGAFAEEEWVGTGGLTLDPFNPGERNGRVRRMYVRPDFRRLGVGRSLLNHVLDAARGRFDILQLYTENPRAAKMYEAAGFQPVDEPKVTHRLLL